MRACELAGEHCRAISKQNEETTFIFTLASDFTLSSDAKSTLYVKAEFIAKLGRYSLHATNNGNCFLKEQFSIECQKVIRNCFIFALLFYSVIGLKKLAQSLTQPIRCKTKTKTNRERWSHAFSRAWRQF